MTYVISQPCVDLKDRACVDECPVDCIYEGKRMLYIHPDECVDCGACEPVCPVEAIFYEDDVPEEWKGYYDANVHFFDDLGSPGGAAKMGEIDHDHPLVAALPAAGARRVIRSVSAAASGLPVGPVGRPRRTRAGAPRRHRRPLGRHARSTRRRPSSSARSPSAADSPGYPLTIGRVETRQACIDWLSRRHGVTGLGLGGVLPVIGSKELIASMPGHLGLGAGDLIVYPELAYPTYEVGAVLAGARGVATDSLTSLGPETPALLWLNSPSNPTGRVLPPEHLKKVVDWCRERGTILVSDECYLECAWEATPVSVLHPSVSGGSHEGILAVHSLVEAVQPRGLPHRLRGRRSGAGRRAARRTQEPRPADAGSAAGRDGRRPRRRRRTSSSSTRATPPAAPSSARRWSPRASGSTTPRRRSTSGRRADEDCWATVSWLAERGILVAPGEFYGKAGGRHVRVAFTATDERVDAALARLTA